MRKNYYAAMISQCVDLSIDEIKEIVQRDSFCKDLEQCYSIIKAENNLSDKEFDEYRKDHMWLGFQLRQFSIAEVKVLDELRKQLEASESVSYYTYAALANIKEGDIKVNSKEMQMLICVALDYFYGMAESDNHLKIERDAIDSFLMYMEKKYLTLSDIRLEEKKRYAFCKQLQTNEIADWWKESGYEYEELEIHQRDCYAQYLESKTKREQLSSEIEKMKKEPFWQVLIDKY